MGFVVTRPIPYLLHLPNRWTNGRGVFRWKLSNFIKNEPTFYTQPTLSSKAGGFLPPCRCEQKVPKKTFARNWAVVETARTSKWCLNESGWVPNISATSELWNKKVGSVLQEHFSDLGILGVVKKKKLQVTLAELPSLKAPFLRLGFLEDKSPSWLHFHQQEILEVPKTFSKPPFFRLQRLVFLGVLNVNWNCKSLWMMISLHKFR